MITVNAIECPNCGTIIFSRAIHDFRSCGCDFNTFCDGGRDYFRYGGKCLLSIIHHTLEVYATDKELYDDWNWNKNCWGKIPKVIS